MRNNIVITGASAGLGAGMARRFAADGRDLALCARRLEQLDALAAELRSANPGIRVITRALDVTDTDDVFTAFEEFRHELGSLDRVIVNAGLGKGRPIGTGYFYANSQTVETNVLGALAQCEAAVRIFRDQRSGHLVLLSSASAVRGLPGNITTYAASKAAVSSLGEGIRADLATTPIRVTTLLPGYIESEMSARSGSAPLLTGADKGARALFAAIERERPKAYIPVWPWLPLSMLMRLVPTPLLQKFV